MCKYFFYFFGIEIVDGNHFLLGRGTKLALCPWSYWAAGWSPLSLGICRCALNRQSQCFTVRPRHVFFGSSLPWLNPSLGHRRNIVAISIVRLPLRFISPNSSQTPLSPHLPPSPFTFPATFRPLPLGLKFCLQTNLSVVSYFFWEAGTHATSPTERIVSIQRCQQVFLHSWLDRSKIVATCCKPVQRATQSQNIHDLQLAPFNASDSIAQK